MFIFLKVWCQLRSSGRSFQEHFLQFGKSRKDGNFFPVEKTVQRALYTMPLLWWPPTWSFACLTLWTQDLVNHTNTLPLVGNVYFHKCPFWKSDAPWNDTCSRCGRGNRVQAFSWCHRMVRLELTEASQGTHLTNEDTKSLAVGHGLPIDT